MIMKKILFLLQALVFFNVCPATADDTFQVAGLIDLRTTYSDGKLDPESLVRLAKKRGFEIVFINDHDRMAMEYGIFPLRNILKKRVELNSINKGGAKKFLDDIREIQKKYPDIILIPGSETAPFYYWSGSYFKKNLTAHNHEKRILTVGLERPEDYRDLPILHNGFSTKHTKNFLPIVLAFFIPFVLGLLLVGHKGFFRLCGILISLASLLFMVNTNPFRSSPFDPYHGDRGIAPYQLLIDYVEARGGLTLWNYPETRSGVRRMGPIRVNTPPYPEVLEQSRGYTGFAALYGDNITVTDPGNMWDKVLLQYCNGLRKRPAWGISTADFHSEDDSGEKLGNFPTVFLVKKKTRRDILFAMREGRMYAYRGRYPQQIILDEFYVSSPDSRARAISGDEIILREDPKIHISLSSRGQSQRPVKVRLIRAGDLIQSFSGPLPMEIDFADKYFEPRRKIYYRIDVQGYGKLVSNPIFVSFE